ncbi:DUF6415 family natural product biosynthesis protein [Streptomyces sp. NPDC049555]|uniref:DUF6415 family natural product biosynthesis protein n=1 Tax=Streptomyces sp. NPDC049555 TaxID=3154930 RepID=UPI0034399E8C
MPPFPFTGHSGGAAIRTDAANIRTINELINETTTNERWLPAPARVRTLTARLRVFVDRTAAEVEAAAVRLPAGDAVRAEALLAVREARHRLGLGAGAGYASAITFARSLGRVAEELLRHQRAMAQVPAVTVPGTAGQGVIVLGPTETCAHCLTLVARRRAQELHRDWSAARRTNAQLAAHRNTAHAALC